MRWILPGATTVSIDNGSGSGTGTTNSSTSVTPAVLNATDYHPGSSACGNHGNPLRRGWS
ncbi:MAG: hypothetical protein K9N23_14470 [Akkermansiaceae bacterium]|nr:hypothetical protein [Akkermansiaceae bacterium]MCF7732890.1 hypothetical protein [Akkermansiaceae bacterium]